MHSDDVLHEVVRLGAFGINAVGSPGLTTPESKAAQLWEQLENR